MPVKVLALTLGLSIASGAAHSSQVYFNDFEGGISLSGAGGIEVVQSYEGVNGISGSFYRNATFSPSSLSLSGLSGHSEIVIEFDLALIDSWDGGVPATCCGGDVIAPDFFNVTVDGIEVLETSNFNPVSPLLLNEMGGDFGFNSSFNDLAYTVSLTLSHSASDVSITFFADGAGYQAGDDESFAIDNLRISTNGAPSPVPLPTTLPLLLGAFGCAAFALRRTNS